MGWFKKTGIDICRKYIGLSEEKNNNQLMALLKSQAINNDISINPKDTSWCSAFLNFCERSIGKKGTGSLMARSWSKIGTDTLRSPVEGDVVVFSDMANDPPDPEKGHVGYFLRFEGNQVWSLGGNQGNKVCEKAFPRSKIIAIRRTNA